MGHLSLTSMVVPRSWLHLFLAVTLFVIQLGISLSDLPSIKLMQDIICKQYYGIITDNMLPEEKCRIEPVQQELNILSMGILISTTIGGAVVSFPLGIIADRVGRLPVLALSLLSICVCQLYAMFVCWQWRSVPLEAIWGMGVALLFGGGRSVAEAMVFAIISDTVTVEKRARWFQWVTSAVLSGQILGPIIADCLVSLSVWVPLFLSLGLMLVGGSSLVAFTPESLPARVSVDAYNERASGVRRSILQTLRALFRGPALWLLPGAVLTIPLATIQSDLLLRLMPLQFDWPLSHSALLLSLRSLITLITLSLVLPVAATFWSKLVCSEVHHADFAMASGSSVFLMTGALCLMIITSESVLITGIILSALGSGLPTLCRAMLVSWMEGQRIGSVLGILAMAEVMGLLAFELGMGALFGVGLRSWIGLPFCLGAAFALVIGLTTWLAPAPWLKDQEGQEL